MTAESAVLDRPGQAMAGYHRDRATWVAFAALFAFGLLNALLGPALPYLRETEHLSYLMGALHQVAFAVGGMTAGILATRSTARRRRTIVLGLSGAGAAALLLGYGHLFALTLLGALAVGALATAALIRMWAWVADLHRRHRAVAMTEGEIAVSLAGIATPALLSVCAATAVGWRFAFVLAFLLVGAAALAVQLTRVVETVPEAQRAIVHDATVTGRESSQRRSLTTIFAVVALEFTLSFWAASYLHDDVGIAQDTATALISALYAANLVGRLIVSRLTRVWPVATVFRLSLAAAFAGVPVLLTASGPAAATLGLIITGAGIGGTFPLASSLHVAGSRRSADQALGQVLTVAGIGQIVGPVAAGAIAQGSSLRWGLLALPALVVLAGTASTSGRARFRRWTPSPER